MAEKKKPAIRFRGFMGEWEERKLGEDVADIVGGGTPNTLNPAYWNGNIDWYTPTEIGKKVYAEDSEKKITELGLQKSSARILPAHKTVLFTSRAGIGDMAILQHLGTTNQGFQSLIIKDGYNTYFIYSIGHLIKKYALKNASGSTFLEISGKKLGKMELMCPSFNEQTKIGAFYQNLDCLIALHQHKYDKLQNFKKSMLEKMFPQNGSCVPEIRFKGFTDDWEQHKLGELCNIYDGTHQTPVYKNSGIMFLSVENIRTLKSKKYISKEDFEKDFSVFPEMGDVLMTRIGDIGTANVVESNEPKAYYVSLALLKKKKLDPYFLKESISSNTVKKEIWQRTLHIAFPKKINKNEIAQVVVIYPLNQDEQKEIGDFFKNLDHLITLHQRKIEKLQNIKKACLEKMFV